MVNGHIKFTKELANRNVIQVKCNKKHLPTTTKNRYKDTQNCVRYFLFPLIHFIFNTFPIEIETVWTKKQKQNNNGLVHISKISNNSIPVNSWIWAYFVILPIIGKESNNNNNRNVFVNSVKYKTQICGMISMKSDIFRMRKIELGPIEPISIGRLT